jgi:hypothetical protein
MRHSGLAFLFLAFLAFFTTAIPLASLESDIQHLSKFNEEKRSSNIVAYERDLVVPNIQLISPVVRSLCSPGDKACDEDSYPNGLEKRGRVRGSRASRKRPAKKKTHRKKKTTTKKPNTGTRPATGTGGKKGGKKTPIKAKAGKSKDYLVVEAAAKKKGKKLVVGKSYLLTEMSGAMISHHKLIVAKVVRKGKGKKKQLDVQATMQQLVLKEGERGTCFDFFGGTCKDAPLKEYSCAKRVESGKGAFKFSGTAKPEFADPNHFIVQGMPVCPII